MTELNPPFALENRADHTAAGDRLLVASIITSEGVAGATDLGVSQQATPDMAVDVAAGQAFIAASSPGVGTYHVSNDATKALTIAASDPSNDRHDIVVAEVRNSFYSGADDDWQLRVVQGTPSASPSDPATPDNAIVLARVVVPASATQITDSDIADLRDPSSAWSSPWGEVAYETDSTAQNFTSSGTTDCTGLSATFTAVEGRVYRITGAIDLNTGGNLDQWEMLVRDGGNTELGRIARFRDGNGADAQRISGWVRHVPGPGSITYKISVDQLSGTNDASRSGVVAYIHVEDIGGIVV